jgi:hypothetical protein
LQYGESRDLLAWRISIGDNCIGPAQEISGDSGDSYIRGWEISGGIEDCDRYTNMINGPTENKTVRTRTKSHSLITSLNFIPFYYYRCAEMSSNINVSYLELSIGRSN